MHSCAAEEVTCCSFEY